MIPETNTEGRPVLDRPQSLFYFVPQESVNLSAKQDCRGSPCTPLTGPASGGGPDGSQALKTQ